MTTSPTPFLAEVTDVKSVIPLSKRAYFQERLRLRLYDLIVAEFVNKKNSTGLTQKDLAARIEKRPEQVNRWLSAPGNWTIDTLSDLLIAISGSELQISIRSIDNHAKRNDRLPSWMEEPLVPFWATKQHVSVEPVAKRPLTERLGNTGSDHKTGLMNQLGAKS